MHLYACYIKDLNFKEGYFTTSQNINLPIKHPNVYQGSHLYETGLVSIVDEAETQSLFSFVFINLLTVLMRFNSFKHFQEVVFSLNSCKTQYMNFERFFQEPQDFCKL